MSRLGRPFDEQGYVVVHNLMSAAELAELSGMSDRLLDGELKPDLAYDGQLPADFYTFWEPGMKERHDLPRRLRVRLMSWMCYHHSWFWEFACRPAIADVMSELYGGGGVQIFSDTVFMKPPRHGIEAAPHQDTAFWPKLSPNAILFWMAIDPATIENGCLHIVPESHRLDLPHRTDPVQGKMLYDDQFDATRQIPIELAPGSALIMDSGLIHRSYPNRSDYSRRAMTSVYVSGDVRHLEPWTQKYKFKRIPGVAAPASA
ncbi:MAG TPA: phytanoyl-CoA dioxygenase family protein [Tepidisphaeraceae bacterium]|nr:phytanoyl-CoA dioxygenase family protein [Tepidisphaeraceae bacterium]